MRSKERLVCMHIRTANKHKTLGTGVLGQVPWGRGSQKEVSGEKIKIKRERETYVLQFVILKQ